MKVGMISFASTTSWEYARCIKEIGLEFVGLADGDEMRGKRASEAFAVPYFSNKENLLSQPIDVVIICSETAHRKGDVLLSAQAEKHVICEMPFATSLRDTQEIIRTCEEKGVLLFPAFPFRYSPPLKRAKELIEDGQIGEILAMKGTHRTKVPQGWQTKKTLAGGGVILQNAVPMIDIMRWLTKEEVAEVYVEIKKTPHLNIEVEDTAALALRFKNGIFATLDPSWCYPSSFPFWGDLSIDIVGRDGTLIVDAFAQVLCHAEGRKASYTKEYWGSDIYSLMLRDYLRYIGEREELPVSPLDGLKALEVALGGYQSGEKKEPVSL